MTRTPLRRLAALLLLLPAACAAPPALDSLPGWAEDRVAEALPAFRAGCARPGMAEAGLSAACAAAADVPPGDEAAARAFLARHFAPDPAGEGLITGYYEPTLRVSPVPTPELSAPLHGRPADLVEADLGRLDPSLAGKRVAGRVEAGRLVPYPDRAAILAGSLPATVLAWADPVEAFFLQIQGSGRTAFPDGTVRRLGYAAQNGRPYVPVGRLLAERGEMAREAVSMQSIVAWLRAAGPARAAALMAENPSYVFFAWREGGPAEGGPAGTLGVPLTPLRSVAVDRGEIPLNTPVWIAARHPLTGAPLRRLVVAQDTGGAIRGRARADLFWGWEAGAAEAAGRMRERGGVWVLRPRAAAP